MPDWAIPLILIFVWVPIFGRLYAWYSDPDDGPHLGLGDKLGRLVFGKRWDYPCGRSFEEKAAQRGRSDNG